VSTDPAATPPTPAPPPADAPPAAPGTPAPAPTDPNQPDWASFNRVAVVAAIAGWALFAIAGFANLAAAEGEAAKHAAKSRFMVGYLSGYIFWASLPLGAMALLMIRYLAKTSWGLLLTRPFEAAIRTLPILFVLFVPLVIAVATKEASPYWWSQPEHTAPHDVKAEPLGAGRGQARADDRNRQDDVQPGDHHPARGRGEGDQRGQLPLPLRARLHRRGDRPLCHLGHDDLFP
jgi:hypothetical protein